MESNFANFSKSYLVALAKHLKLHSVLMPQVARKLGLRAVKIGLETLDLARIHEEALIALILPHHSESVGDGIILRAGLFFTEAITPLVETHRGALESNAKLKVMLKSLKQRTIELANANKQLKVEITQRKSIEKSLRVSEQTSSQLLTKALLMQDEQKLLSRRLLFAQEDERKRISRELHHVVAQNLAGINLRLGSLKSKSTSNTKDLNEKIEQTQRIVENSVDIVHRFARDLRPAVLDDLGLVPALRSFIKDFIEQTGIGVTCTVLPGIEELSSTGRTVLYRIAQESLANVARHAKATHAKVSIHKLVDAVCLEIHDNGSGFRVEKEGGNPNSKRLGLLGMKERVEMVGGTFCVESSPGHATTVRVEIPNEFPKSKKLQKKKTKKAKLECV